MFFCHCSMIRVARVATPWITTCLSSLFWSVPSLSVRTLNLDGQRLVNGSSAVTMALTRTTHRRKLPHRRMPLDSSSELSMLRRRLNELERAEQKRTAREAKKVADDLAKKEEDARKIDD